jgi:AcrR family transcriptional regulator
MLVQASDLTPAVRIRNGALEGFAEKGVAATSIADVAEAAGVSPGLVQHYFETKAGLRQAVDAYVLAVVQDAFSQLLGTGPAANSFQEAGDRITSVIHDHRTAVLYTARSIAEGDEAALDLFDGFVGIARSQLRRLAEAGDVDPDIDFEWTALHIITNIIGTVLFESAVNRHLPERLFTSNGLDRWNRATTKLFQRGLAKADRERAD